VRRINSINNGEDGFDRAFWILSSRLMRRDAKLKKTMKRINPIENDASGSLNELDTLERRFEELSAFSGEWLLLYGDQLLKHSRDYRDIDAEIQKRGLKDCLVHYVPTTSERDFILV
jgi:hypothetical protein